MERGRSFRVSKRRRNKNRKTNHIQIHYPGPSLLDLPKDILQNILFRLPVKSIYVCKFVCKTCHDLISDPEFDKLHFDETRDRFYPLIHADKKFYLLQPDKDDFEPNNADFVFNTKFALSAFIRDLLLESSRCYGGYRRDNPPGQKVGLLACRRQCITRIVNSCNGLLCLVISCLISHVNICNPITGEYITIPEGNTHGYLIKIPQGNKYGFGFSHIANKYKVVRISNENRSAQLHIVGTESWRDIDSKPKYLIHCNPIYFKGFLYWPTSKISLSLMLFDIENESFGLDSGPMDKPYKYVLVNVGILRGELCISCVTKSKTIHIWAKKDSGVEITQWSKVYSIDLCGMPIEGSLEPIEFLSDGSLLMFYYHINAFIYVDPGKCRFRFFKIKGDKMKVEQILAHAPSLVSLKHPLSGHNVEVLNDLYQRCEVLKLRK